ncbi:MAG: tetratricopeptide repeat protein [Desulfobacterales bacterium]|nr:tetratricopeptide repeat protein [Desulfobacterales bacterium]
MAKKKRVTRKQLLKEPDEFLTFSAKAIQFAAYNRRSISFALVGLVIACLAFGVFKYFSNLSERRAYSVFEQGLVHYLAQASVGKSPHFQQMAIEKFEEVLKRYPSTSAGELSLLLRANMSYDEGSYDKAIELYQKALGAFSEEGVLRKLVWNNLGYAYEGKKDYSAAAQCFEKITEPEGEFMKADAYFNLARMHEAMGNRQKAIEAYNKVADDYPGSVNFQICKEKVLRLKGQR